MTSGFGVLRRPRLMSVNDLVSGRLALLELRDGTDELARDCDQPYAAEIKYHRTNVTSTGLENCAREEWQRNGPNLKGHSKAKWRPLAARAA